MGVKFTSSLKAAARLIREQAEEKKKEVADLLLERAKDGLQGERHGRTYRIPGTDRTYTASAPGEWPAERTGALRASMQVRVAGGGEVAVGSNRDEVESIHDERPFLGQLVAEVQPEVGQLLNRPWFQVERGLGH